MLNRIETFKYYQTSSKYHALNPIIKLLSLIINVIIVFMLNNYIEYLIYMCLLSLVILLTNIPLKVYFKQLKAISMMMIFLLFFNTLFRVDFLLTISVIAKTYLLVIVSSILMLTTTPTDINTSLEKILSPVKKILPVKEIALLISLALRFIPTISSETTRIIRSIKNYGLDFTKGTINDKIKVVRYMLLPTFILTLKRSDDVADVMELRLCGMQERTSFKDNVYRDLDYFLILIEILLLVILIVR